MSAKTEQDPSHDFNKCVKRKRYADGYEILCRLGLWSVFATTEWQAEREAVRYWIQYYQDGEYARLLAE